ncbi:MAG: hypothetical protein COX79_02220 [Candidatus Levybacteria bacterium CG_4_10_14_0_2_um_filter_36_16]|nr:MAG: hypothetical protein AUK12_00735 [Candidatus Levybacteria bacterium CG2_30_37_29]PIR78844.1 MAG: hypothetical protein COU26_04450 [Candidatus Levybacteria bacterium CG10_big_fil_rev_8_21_14_0_10_36_30]PIZ97438.1 MAG: hypothetical protein COX79_02220 [Candidatus Levybacteria bacterium CG_4_10_14_0_2_um_filter_36_16]
MPKFKDRYKLDILLFDYCKNYFLQHRYKIYGLLLLLIGSLNLIQLPYFNLIFTYVTVFLFIALYGAIVLRINGKIYIILGLFLLVIALTFVLISQAKIAQEIGDCIYILFVLGTFSLLIDIRKQKTS